MEWDPIAIIRELGALGLLGFMLVKLPGRLGRILERLARVEEKVDRVSRALDVVDASAERATRPLLRADRA